MELVPPVESQPHVVVTRPTALRSKKFEKLVYNVSPGIQKAKRSFHTL